MPRSYRRSSASPPCRGRDLRNIHDTSGSDDGDDYETGFHDCGISFSLVAAKTFENQNEGISAISFPGRAGRCEVNSIRIRIDKTGRTVDVGPVLLRSDAADYVHRIDEFAGEEENYFVIGTCPEAGITSRTSTGYLAAAQLFAVDPHKHPLIGQEGT